jgi:hypothetical protein
MFYRALQRAEGDELAREMLAAGREVARRDRQLSTAQIASLLEHYDQVERELFPGPSSNQQLA